MAIKTTFLINKSEIAAGTRGASLGPEAIMAAARTKGSSFFADKQLVHLQHWNDVLDHGSRSMCAKYIQALTMVYKEVAEQVCTTITDKSFPFILAGDHGSAGGTIAGIKKAHPSKRLGVVWIDAHGDLHTPFTTPSGNMHGMPLATALKEDNKVCQVNEPSNEEVELWESLKNTAFEGEKLNPEDLVFIAVRDTEEQEDQLIERLRIKNYTVDQVSAEGSVAIAEKTLKRLEACDIIYVSFDVDSMDPKATSHGTGTPVKHGLMPKQAKEILQKLIQSPKVICLEVVEVNPTLDEKKNRMGEITFDIIEQVYQTLQAR